MRAKAVSSTKQESLTLDVVADARRLQRHLNGSKRTGRPIKLTPRLFIKICRQVQLGGVETSICEAEGIWRGTLWEICQRRPNWKKRLEKAREIRRDVWHEMHVQNILKQAPKNVVASLWWLERNFPDRYALRTISRQINSHELVLDRVSPEQLIEDVRLAQEVANERAQLPSPVSVSDG